MIASPRINARVQCWYAERWRKVAPLHGKVGVVVISSRGKPRNHLLEIDGRLYVVPCGNLRKEQRCLVTSGG